MELEEVEGISQPECLAGLGHHLLEFARQMGQGGAMERRLWGNRPGFHGIVVFMAP